MAFFRNMKNIIWIVLNCTLIFNLITISNCIENEDELNVDLRSSNSSSQEVLNVSTVFYQTNERVNNLIIKF